MASYVCFELRVVSTTTGPLRYTTSSVCHKNMLCFMVSRYGTSPNTNTLLVLHNSAFTDRLRIVFGTMYTVGGLGTSAA